MTASPRPRHRSLTPWELPRLLTPLHRHRRAALRRGRERPHFLAIVRFVYENRLAVASQIRRRFPKELRSDRTTRRHLVELEALGYLAVVPTQATGPLFPKAFRATGRGLRRRHQGLAADGTSWHPARVPRNRGHRRAGVSADHVLHDVLITEFLLAVWQTIEQRPDLELHAIERRSLVKHPAFRLRLDQRQTHLEPDALFVFRQHGGDRVICFVEIDLGSMNVKMMRTKFRRYDAWARTEHGQQYLRQFAGKAAERTPTFRVLMVAGDRTNAGGRSRLIELLPVLMDLPRSMRERVWLTSLADVRAHQDDPLPLGSAIWTRGRDARPWRDSYRSLDTATTPHEQRQVRARQRSFIKQQLADMPLHPLFPRAA